MTENVGPGSNVYLGGGRWVGRCDVVGRWGRGNYPTNIQLLSTATIPNTIFGRLRLPWLGLCHWGWQQDELGLLDAQRIIDGTRRELAVVAELREGYESAAAHATTELQQRQQELETARAQVTARSPTDLFYK